MTTKKSPGPCKPFYFSEIVSLQITAAIFKMKLKHIIILGLLISLATLLLAAAKAENGDTNAISMYFVVFLVPVILIAVFNGTFIASLDRQQNRSKKIILSFIPLILMIVLSQLKNIQLNFFDGSISFVGFVGAIGVGLTNMIWVLSLFRNE